MMDVPKIKLATGEEVTLPRPNMKMWRLVAEYDEKNKDEWTFHELMIEHAKIVGQMFGVNPDDIDPAYVVPGYLDGARYVINLVNEKLKKLPNAEAEEAK